MNHHRKIPGDPFMGAQPLPEFRANFPVRYYLPVMDFGCSVYFTPSLRRLHDGLVKVFTIAREQCAPKMYGYLCSDTTLLCMVCSTFVNFFFCGIFDRNRLPTAIIGYCSGGS